MISFGFGDVYLDVVDPENLEQMRLWRNLPQIWASCRQNDLISKVDQQSWFQHVVCGDPSVRMYTVKTRKDGLVGVCGLTSLDKSHQRAEFSLYIGPGYQKLGIGTAALKTLINHGFKNLNLNCIWAEVFETNAHALKMFQDVGFTKEGFRREFYFKDGKFVGAHVVSLLRHETQWT